MRKNIVIAVLSTYIIFDLLLSFIITSIDPNYINNILNIIDINRLIIVFLISVVLGYLIYYFLN